MDKKSSVNEVECFKKTLARLNRSMEVDVVSPLDRHILDIFNKMSDLSKLQILLNCCTGARKNCMFLDNDSQDANNEELSDIEKANSLEMIRLKTWAAKATFVLVGFSFSMLGVAMAIAGKDPTAFIAKNLEFGWKVLSLIFS